MSRDSVVSVATRYGMGGPDIEFRWGEARFSATVQTGTDAHPDTYTMGTGSFPVVKRPERGDDYPTPSSAEVKERVELYPLLQLWVFVVCSRVNFTFTRKRKKRLCRDHKIISLIAQCAQQHCTKHPAHTYIYFFKMNCVDPRRFNRGKT